MRGLTKLSAKRSPLDPAPHIQDLIDEGLGTVERLPQLVGTLARRRDDLRERVTARVNEIRKDALPPDNPERRNFLAQAPSIAADAFAERATNAAHNMVERAQNLDFSPLTNTARDLKQEFDDFNRRKLQSAPPDSPGRRDFLANLPANAVTHMVPMAYNAARAALAREGGLKRIVKGVAGGAAERLAANDAAPAVLTAAGAGVLAHTLIGRGFRGAQLPASMRQALKGHIARTLASASVEHLEQKRARQQEIADLAQRTGLPVDHIEQRLHELTSRPALERFSEALDSDEQVTRRNAAARIAAHLIAEPPAPRPTPYMDQYDQNRALARQSIQPNSKPTSFIGPRGSFLTAASPGDLVAEQLVQPTFDMLSSARGVTDEDLVNKGVRTQSQTTRDIVDSRVALMRLNKVLDAVNLGKDPLPDIVRMALAEKMRTEGIHTVPQILELLSYAIPQGGGGPMRMLLEQNRVDALRRDPREWARLARMSDDEIAAEAAQQVKGIPARFKDLLRRKGRELALSQQLKSGPMSTQATPATDTVERPRPMIIGRRQP